MLSLGRDRREVREKHSFLYRQNVLSCPTLLLFCVRFFLFPLSFRRGRAYPGVCSVSLEAPRPAPHGPHEHTESQIPALHTLGAELTRSSRYPPSKPTSHFPLSDPFFSLFCPSHRTTATLSTFILSAGRLGVKKWPPSSSLRRASLGRVFFLPFLPCSFVLSDPTMCTSNVRDDRINLLLSLCGFFFLTTLYENPPLSIP